MNQHLSATFFALGLGANLDSPEHRLAEAIRALQLRLGPLTVAPLYRSVPHSPIPQPTFLNTVVLGTTTNSAWELLRFAKQLESDAGRLPGPPLAPRPLDIDVLVYGDQVIHEPDLIVPHPRLALRRFVLAPLAAIAPHFSIPPHGQTVAELLSVVGQEHEVERIDWSSRI